MALPAAATKVDRGRATDLAVTHPRCANSDRACHRPGSRCRSRSARRLRHRPTSGRQTCG
jgi:hypothetical protein